MKTKITKTLLLSALLLGTGIAKAQWTASGTYGLLGATYTSGIAGSTSTTPIPSALITSITGSSTNNGGLQITTPYGNVIIGPQNNTGFCHFTAGSVSNSFYFNKPVTVNGAISSYSGLDLTFQTSAISTGGTTRMTINHTSGNVGIGTTSPSTALEVHGSGISVYSSNSNNSLFFGQDQTTTLGEWGVQYVTSGTLGTGAFAGLNFWKPSVSGNFGNNFLFLADNGNIGIGTAKPGYLLDVAGTIRSYEVKVCTSGCDFVFEQGYKLMCLDDLDKYVTQNHHLPEIAPAKEMQADGMGLAKMDSQLLQKVEELTLYVIQQQKKIDALETKLGALETQKQ